MRKILYVFGLDLYKSNTARAMIDRFRICYNFIRSHMALDRKTPAEEAKASPQLDENKRKSLIKKSTEHQQMQTHPLQDYRGERISTAN